MWVSVTPLVQESLKWPAGALLGIISISKSNQYICTHVHFENESPLEILILMRSAIMITPPLSPLVGHLPRSQTERQDFCIPETYCTMHMLATILRGRYGWPTTGLIGAR